MNFNFVRYFNDITRAEGKKRHVYAWVNILYFFLSALCVWGLAALYRYNQEQAVNCTGGAMVLLSWLGLLACLAGAIEFFALGVLAQFVLLVCSIIAMFQPDKRKAHVLPLLVSTLSILAAIILFIVFIL